MHLKLTFPLIVAALLLLAACTDQAQQSPPPAAEPEAQAESAQPQQASAQIQQAAAPADEPEAQAESARISIRDAVNFSVDYQGAAKIVHVVEAAPGAGGAVYILVQRGAAEPSGGWAGLAAELLAAHDLGEPTVIEVPLQSIFASSTTQLPALEILGVLDRLTGVAQSGLVSSEAVRALIDAGGLVEFAPMFSVDAEIVLAARPDVLMTSGFWDDAYEVIQQRRYGDCPQQRLG